jgi:acylphosphatase
MTGQKKNLQINISGRVQGVGFRYSAVHKAQQLGIKGFVKNMYDGSVFIEAEADEISMDHFLIWCNKGPTFSRVEKVSTTEGTVKNYSTFSVKY